MRINGNAEYNRRMIDIMRITKESDESGTELALFNMGNKLIQDEFRRPIHE